MSFYINHLVQPLILLNTSNSIW